MENSQKGNSLELATISAQFFDCLVCVSTAFGRLPYITLKIYSTRSAISSAKSRWKFALEA